MRKIISTILCLLALSFFCSAQSASKQLAKSFPIDRADEIVLQLPGTSNIIVWEKNYVSIQIGISVSSFSQGILDELARVGRYDLQSNIHDNVLTISAPKAGKQVTIRGQLLAENYDYQVFVPKNTPIRIELDEQRTIAMRE